MAVTGGIQLITPLPPLPTGIAAYSADLLRAIGGAWPFYVITEPGSSWGELEASYNFVKVNQIDESSPLIVQIGNSEQHPIAFSYAERGGEILVLHDVVLHHARMIDAVRTGCTDAYRRELYRRYGEAGLRAGEDLIYGRPVEDIAAYPMSERYIERARLTIVHNSYAESRVRQLVPDAAVMRVPMGIPLPKLLSKREARKRLGIADNVFVVASITHINPYKRLDVVLRALRRVIGRVPQTRLIVAGTLSPEVPVERQAWMLGIDSHVTIEGYVTDDRARLLAQAADVCVNLRYPTLGETSASLLRLLGAGKPVIITEGTMSEDIPPGAAIPVPVGGLEEEMIAEVLVWLAEDPESRNLIGATARRFVEREHAMQVAIDGYRGALLSAYGMQLPATASAVLEEDFPVLYQGTEGTLAESVQRVAPSRLGQRIIDSLANLGLYRTDGLHQRIAQATVELGLDRLLPYETSREPVAVSSGRLSERLRCPLCGAGVRFAGDLVVCGGCASRFPVRRGVPDFRTR
ncbi:MAG: glycosyltransferase [Chloroflexota bacterium]